jgi:hypothetical protein
VLGRLPDDHVAHLRRQAQVQVVAGQLFDISGIAQLLVLRFELFAVDPDLLALGLKLVDLPTLGDVLTHRIGQAERDRAEHYRQHRGPASEVRPSHR